jgi:hypothetical protein
VPPPPQEAHFLEVLPAAAAMRADSRPIARACTPHWFHVSHEITGFTGLYFDYPALQNLIANP